MLEIVRERCPGLVPPDPVGPSVAAPQVPVDPHTTRELFAVAALHATGLLDLAGRQTGEAVVWAEHDRELLVEAARVSVRLGPGVVAVTIPVRCEEVGATAVHVTFAVGDPDRPAGLLAATEERPRGPRLVVELWGEALVAFAWTLLLQVAAHVARAAGTDEDGAGLVPAAVAASPDGIGVLPQARHAFDRVIQP
jgi:hypothetical protein